jgi:alginate O-acetyltransferase complex protein AlgI
MLFSSLSFTFIFLPLTVAAFFAARRVSGIRAAMGLLVGASFVFYAVWSPPLVALLAGSIVGNYLLGEWARRSLRAHRIVIVGIASNLAILGYFKYAGFLATTAGIFVDGLAVPDIILPIGISFFTFQQIAYLVDIGRKRAEPVSLLHYALFISFFPQLIAGPIVYHREILPQFQREDFGRFSWRNITVGVSVFVAGLAQKVLLADTLAGPANDVFAAVNTGQDVMFLEAWGGVLAFTFQIYFDFAGYSNMAIGMAALLGIRLPINFNTPYLAVNVVEFWGRWHITLSRFLRDFLYIPLGGNRKGMIRRYLNLVITMVLGGLWHGAAWTFVFWSLLHGVFLGINHSWRSLRKRVAAIPQLPPLVSWGTTFMVVVIAGVFFRAESFSDAWSMLGVMFGIGGLSLPASLPLTPAIPGINYDTALVLSIPKTFPLLLVAAVFAVMPNVQRLFGAYFPGIPLVADRIDGAPELLRWRPTVRWALIVSALAAFSLFVVFVRTQPVAFVYFQF